MDISQTSHTGTRNERSLTRSVLEPFPIPPQLKFLMSNIKGTISLTLTAENFPIWRSQVFKLFRANGFDGFLDGSCTCPSPDAPPSADNLSYHSWNLLDQNLAASLYSVISPSILPYVLSLEHCADIWATLSHRLQSSTRSRSMQLRNELHHLSMNNQTMAQYLLSIKSKVDAIAATGTPLHPEEVILYTLNGLPSQYNSFKTSIRTNLNPISLDDLYSLLCSEEQCLVQQTTKEIQQIHLSEPTVALAAPRGRGRDRRPSSGARKSYQNRNNSSTNPPVSTQRSTTTCQICFKTDHSALKCWHRHDPNYTDEPSKTALFSPTDSNASQEWYLDSGATSHLTSDLTNLSSSKPYEGSHHITLGNGHQIPIHHSGKGLLPTPQGFEDGSSSSHGALP